MPILAIESTCDETAAAVVDEGWRVCSNVVASQVELHAKYHGVVPEIASRAHIENILPVVREALTAANATLAEMDAIAVAHRPGLIGSLLIGVTAAKSLAWALGKPLIGVDHIHAHLYSVVLEKNVIPPMPAVGLVCSGGHTALYRIGDFLDIELIGSTIDDAVGEAYDKVAAILGLGYPGGPVIDQLARMGSPTAVAFPRSMLERDSLDFSFSGLKTAVLYHVRGFGGKSRAVGDPSLPSPGTPGEGRVGADFEVRDNMQKSPPPRPSPGVPGEGEKREKRSLVATRPPLSAQELHDVAASFQAACIDVLVKKLRRAVERTGAQSVIVGGGVSANQGLRSALANFMVPACFPPMRFCTDNAAMSAGLAHLYYRAGRFSSLDLDAVTYSQFARQP